MVSKHQFGMFHLSAKPLSHHAGLTAAIPTATLSISCTSQSWLSTKLVESVLQWKWER